MCQNNQVELVNWKVVEKAGGNWKLLDVAPVTMREVATSAVKAIYGASQLEATNYGVRFASGIRFQFSVFVFSLRYSVFSLQYSVFGIQYSVFGIQYSVFARGSDTAPKSSPLESYNFPMTPCIDFLGICLTVCQV